MYRGRLLSDSDLGERDLVETSKARRKATGFRLSFVAPLELSRAMATTPGSRAWIS
jgi:hypothetical protein